MKNITKRLVVMLLLVATVVGVLPTTVAKAATKKDTYVTKKQFICQLTKAIDKKAPKTDDKTLAYAKKIGIFKDSEVKKANYNKSLTRFEMATFATRALKIVEKKSNLKLVEGIELLISDYTKCKNKTQQVAVKTVYSYGIVSGTKFNGNSKVTISTASTVIKRVANAKARLKVTADDGITENDIDILTNLYWCYEVNEDTTVSTYVEMLKDKKATFKMLKAAGVKDNQSESEKYARILKWVFTNIKYDHGAYYYDTAPADILKSKETCCGGFSNITIAMCRYAGIDAVYVTGGNNHCWVVVKIDGEWWYSDPTNCRGTHMLNVLSSCTPDEKAETKEAMEYAIKKFGGKIKTMKSNFCVWEMNTSGLPIKGADYVCQYQKADEYWTIKYCFYGKDPITVTYQTEDDYDKAFDDDDDDDDELWDFDDENIVYLDESEYALYFN